MNVKRLTLDETWDLCLKMWKWIAAEKKKQNQRPMHALKRTWLVKNGFAWMDIAADCFFCEYDEQKLTKYRRIGECCEYCPGKKIDKDFDCQLDPNFAKEPIKFYNLLKKLNKERMKAKKEIKPTPFL